MRKTQIILLALLILALAALPLFFLLKPRSDAGDLKRLTDATANQKASPRTDQGNILELLAGLETFAQFNPQGRMPPDMGSMVRSDTLAIPGEAYLSPQSSVKLPEHWNEGSDDEKHYWININTSYGLMAALHQPDPNPRKIILYTKYAFAVDGKVTVGFGDGHIEVLPVERVKWLIRRQQGFDDPEPGVAATQSATTQPRN